LAAHLLGDNDYDVLLTEDCDVYKPDGSLLAKLRQNVLSEQECVRAFPVWKDAAHNTFNRGHAAGKLTPQAVEEFVKEKGQKVKVVSATRAHVIKNDGTVSFTKVAKPVQSGIVGYFDHAPKNLRFPYCRLTAYNLNHPDRFRIVMPFIRQVDAEFKRLVPDRYDAQLGFVQETSPDFFIHGTSFTTVTVNRNFQTAVHQDVGDLKQGFGVMSCLRRGRFHGCYFVFPKYRVAFDMRTGCVLCADVHEWHGNSPMLGNKGMYERVSLVFYYRERMRECGSAQEELEKVKRRPRSFKERPAHY